MLQHLAVQQDTSLYMNVEMQLSLSKSAMISILPFVNLVYRTGQNLAYRNLSYPPDVSLWDQFTWSPSLMMTVL